MKFGKWDKVNVVTPHARCDNALIVEGTCDLNGKETYMVYMPNLCINEGFPVGGVDFPIPVDADCLKLAKTYKGSVYIGSDE